MGDKEDQRVNDFLGMSPDEQLEHYGKQQVHNTVDKTQEAIDAIFKETLLDTNDWASFIDWWSIPDKTDEEFHAYLKSFVKSGYKYQQAEIEHLKAENEDMKCCGNCGNLTIDEDGDPICYLTRVSYAGFYRCDHWKPKENN